MWDFYKLRQKLIELFEDSELHPLSEKPKFAEVGLPIEGIPKVIWPKADFAAQFDETHLYVEVDSGQGVSHNLAKYFYIFDNLKSIPKRILIFHILGPGFRVNKHNYEFHQKLASFLAKKIEDAFRNEFEFHYEQSDPFLSNEKALKWFSEKLRVYNIKKKV